MFTIEGKTNQELVVMAGSLALILRPAIAGQVYGGETKTHSSIDGDSIKTTMNCEFAIDFGGDIRGVIEQEILPQAVELWEVSEKLNIRNAVEQMFGLDVLKVIQKGKFPDLEERKPEALTEIPNNVRELFVSRRR